MDLGLQGRVALVGGASAGLGRAIAAELVAEGATVAVSSRSRERIDEAARAIGATPFVWDSADLDAAPALLDAVTAALGPVDILVTNTGGPPRDPDPLGFSREAWEAAHRSLVLAPLALVEGVLAGMRERGFGRIVYVGSTSVREPIAGLMLFSFRKLAPRKLATIGGLLLLGAALMGMYRLADKVQKHDAAVAAQQVEASGAVLTEKQTGTIKACKNVELGYWPTAEDKAEQIELHSGSWWSAVKGQFDSSYDSQWTTLPRWLMLDMIPFMLIGMALLKWGVLSGQRSVGTYVAMMVGGYSVGIPLGLYELGIVMDGNFATLAFAKAGETYQFSRFAMVIGHLGLALLVIRLGLLKGLQRGLAAVGQMALSNYIAHTIICTALFYGFGFGLFSYFDRHQLYYVVFAIWVAQLIWSPIWLSHFQFGPIEWLWRSLTYWKRQPMKVATDQGLRTGMSDLDENAARGERKLASPS